MPILSETRPSFDSVWVAQGQAKNKSQLKAEKQKTVEKAARMQVAGIIYERVKPLIVAHFKEAFETLRASSDSSKAVLNQIDIPIASFMTSEDIDGYEGYFSDDNSMDYSNYLTPGLEAAVQFAVEMLSKENGDLGFSWDWHSAADGFRDNDWNELLLTVTLKKPVRASAPSAPDNIRFAGDTYSLVEQSREAALQNINERIASAINQSLDRDLNDLIMAIEDDDDVDVAQFKLGYDIKDFYRGLVRADESLPKTLTQTERGRVHEALHEIFEADSRGLSVSKGEGHKLVFSIPTTQ